VSTVKTPFLPKKIPHNVHSPRPRRGPATCACGLPARGSNARSQVPKRMLGPYSPLTPFALCNAKRGFRPRCRGKLLPPGTGPEGLSSNLASALPPGIEKPCYSTAGRKVPIAEENTLKIPGPCRFGALRLAARCELEGILPLFTQVARLSSIQTHATADIQPLHVAAGGEGGHGARVCAWSATRPRRVPNRRGWYAVQLVRSSASATGRLNVRGHTLSRLAGSSRAEWLEGTRRLSTRHPPGASCIIGVVALESPAWIRRCSWAPPGPGI
jgi:hypothetical protein